MYSVVDREAIQHKICLRIANGESLLTISKDESMPHEETMYAWIKKHADFSKNYMQARLDQAEVFATEIMDIGDGLINGDKIITREDIEIAKVRIDSRKWIASKLLPKKYGPPAVGPTVLINTQPITGMKIIDIEAEEAKEVE